MVTESPLMSDWRMAARASAAAPGATSKADERHVSPNPSAAKAALCNRGDREWAKGLPMTPPRRTAGPASARARSMVRSGSGEATGLGDLLVGQLLGVGVRKG